MAFDSSRWRRWTAIACVMVAVGAALAGSYAFLISLRPCRLNLSPGTVVDFHLATEYRVLQEGELGPPRERTARITLVCIGHGNEVALVEPDGERDGISLLSFQTDGTARLLGDDGLADVGKALGFFDFNLLPLPPGNEQSWKVSLVYATLPPGRRQVLAQVRRTASGARPEFELRLPTVEWVNDHNRYVQVRNLVCRYRFDPARGIVDRARVTCETGVEAAAGPVRHRVQVALDLIGIQHSSGDTAALRDLALATAATQSAIAAEHYERLVPLMTRLEQRGVEVAALREIADRLRLQARGRLHGGPTNVPRPVPLGNELRDIPEERQPIAVVPPGTVELQVATVAPSRRVQAEALVTKLVAAGIPARVQTSGNWLVVRAGPFVGRDAQVAARVKALSGSAPLWRTITP